MVAGWERIGLLLALLLLVAFRTVNSAGQLQFRIVSFTNPNSLLADGERCCEAAPGSGDVTCTGPCRTFFRVCAAAEGAGIARQSPPAVRLSRISRLRSRRARRSPAADAQRFTDTPVPSGLPPVGDEDELLPAAEGVAPLQEPAEPVGRWTDEEPVGGTSIQVIHHLISTAEDDELTGRAATGRSPGDDSPVDLQPSEASSSEGELSLEDPEGAQEDSAMEETPKEESTLAGSALVGLSASRQPPTNPQDIGLVFVEDKDYIHLFFQPRHPHDRSRVNGDITGDPPRVGGRHRRSVFVDGSTSQQTPSINDATIISSEPTDGAEATEGSGVQEEQNLEEKEFNTDSFHEAKPLSSPRKLSSRTDGPHLQVTSECSLGVLVTGAVDNSSLTATGQAPVELSFLFSTPWPGRVRLVVEAWHDVTGALEPASAVPSWSDSADSPRLISRTIIRRRQPAGNWTSDVSSVANTRLEFQLRVTCDAGSSGTHCATACDLVAGRRGHWVCAEDGSVTCQPGWRGPVCDEPICKEGCHALTGYCRVPGECLCKIGYRGELCSECVPLPGCRHGHCKRSFECRCRDGWTGLFCNKPICSKGCDKDRGYCTKPNECRCRVGWTGKRCTKCKRLPGCRNGTCRQPMDCRCRPGWTGFLCERAICKTGCSKEHGYCERPDVCRCDLGWRGELCDTCLPYPGCLHGNCSRPWQCNCQPGWTGFLCDTPEDPCSHQPGLCKNRGSCEVSSDEGLPVAVCRCPAGFSGATCEDAATPTSRLTSGPSGGTARSISDDSSGGGGGGGGGGSGSGGGGSGGSSFRWPWGRPRVVSRDGTAGTVHVVPRRR